MIRIAGIVLMLLALAGAACGPTDGTGNLTELGRMQSGDLEVVLLSDETAISSDRGSFVLEFRSTSDGSLIDVGRVTAGATMPMPGSSPMFGDLELEPTAVPGRYAGTGDFGMAGTWRLTVEWEGPAGSGSASLATRVR
jgi:hypothetical protein